MQSIKRLGAMAVCFAVVAVLGAAAYAGCGACGADHEETEQPHAKVGEAAPNFTLTADDGQTVELAKLTEEKKIVVLEWFNPDCPYVKKHHEKMSTMTDLAAKYKDKDVVWLAVNSSHYADSEYNKKWAKTWKIDYPILVDQDGKVGHLYAAKTTPHMFIIDAKGTLAYAGAIDDHPKPKAYTEEDGVTNYVDNALTQLINDEQVSVAETKPYGCSVKYKK